MTIKEIRLQSGLTQKGFSDHYHIPLQTLKQWESAPGSSSHRTPPDYLLYMLQLLTANEFGTVTSPVKSRTEAMIKHALESRYNAKHWLRYLRKEITGDKTKLSESDINTLANSDDLTMYQKVVLIRSVVPGTPTNRYVVGLNKRSNTSMLKELIKEHANDGK